MLNDEQRRLIEDNLLLGPYFVQKYCGEHMRDKWELDELVSMAYEAMCRAAAKFDASKGAYGTLAGIHVQNSIRQELRKERSRRRAIPWMLSLDAPVKGNADATLGEVLGETDEPFGGDMLGLLDAVAALPCRERMAIYEAAEGKSQREIAMRMGVSQPHASRVLKSTRSTLREATGMRMSRAFKQMCRLPAGGTATAGWHGDNDMRHRARGRTAGCDRAVRT